MIRSTRTFTAPVLQTAPAAQRPSKVAKLASAGADLVTIAFTMLLAWILHPTLPGAAPFNAHLQHFAVAMGSLPVWIAIFAHYRLYSARKVATRLEEFRRLVHAIGASVIAIAFGGLL